MIGETLEMPSKTRKKVEQHEIGSMLRRIHMDQGIPGYKYDELAAAIEQEFGVMCTSQDVKDYEQLHVLGEDYELEGRRHNYGMQGRLRQMLRV